MKWFFATALALIVSAAGAQAQDTTESASIIIFDEQVPEAVEAYARELEAGCVDTSNQKRSPDFITLAAKGPHGRIFMVDASKSICPNMLCGSGGCALGVFREKDGVTTRVSEHLARRWTITNDGATAIIYVQGSSCDRAVAEPCAVELDLGTGERKIFRPSD